MQDEGTTASFVAPDTISISEEHRTDTRSHGADVQLRVRRTGLASRHAGAIEQTRSSRPLWSADGGRGGRLTGSVPAAARAASEARAEQHD